MKGFFYFSTKLSAVNIEALYQIYIQNPHIETDTRKLKNGSIFWALKGPNFDGNQFVQKALELGACCCVIDNPDFQIDQKTFLVEDGLKALQKLALFHRQKLNIPFIAITGSNGKTTTKELIAAVLQTQFKIVATKGNLNNHIGVPLTLLSIPFETEIAVIEMGANHQLEIESYCEIALPTHGLITNIGKAHLEGFGGIEGVKKGKGELYQFLKTNNGIIFRNCDQTQLLEIAPQTLRQVTYGESLDADYSGRFSTKNGLLSVQIDNEQINTQLFGDYNFANVMAAVAVAAHFGVEFKNVKSAIESYQPDNSRSQVMQIGTNTIVMDAYNANPTSMRVAIDNLANSIAEDKRLYLGSMKEMGKESEQEHQSLVTYISKFNWQEVMLVGDEFKPFSSGLLWFSNSEAAMLYLKENCPSNCTILIKGSRGSRMEKLLEGLAQ